MKLISHVARFALIVALIGASITLPVKASGSYLDTFEDGSLDSRWTTVEGSWGVTSPGYEGDYKLSTPNSAEEVVLTKSSATQPSSISFWASFGSASDFGSTTINDNSGTQMDNAHYESDETYRVEAGGSYPKVADVPANTWVHVIYYNIDYSAGTFDIRIEDTDGNVMGKLTGVSHSASNIKSISWYTYQQNGLKVDNIRVNGPVSRQVSGTVTTSDGDAIENATIETDSGKSTTTNETGYYSFQLEDGNYTLATSRSGYKNASQNITVDGSDVSGVDFSLVDADQFEMAFTLTDQTNATIFEGEDPRLIVERPDGSLTTISFNHNQRAFVGMLDGRMYNFTVTSDYPAVWESKGFIAVQSIPEGPLVMDPSLGWDTNTLATPTEGETPTVDERLDVRFAELENELGSNGTAVTVQSSEPMERVEYVIRDENGTSLYNGSREFEEPTRFYQGQLSDNVTNNASQAEEPTLEYSGTFENGSAFNGTTDLSASFGSSGAFGGPIGSSSGGGSAPTGGVVLLAGGTAVAAYRYRRPIINAASNAAGRLTG